MKDAPAHNQDASSEKEHNPFSLLPDEAIMALLRKLPPKNLIHFGLTNKRHYELATDNMLWKGMLDRYAPRAREVNQDRYNNNPKNLFKNYFSKEAVLNGLLVESAGAAAKRLYGNFIRYFLQWIAAVKYICNKLGDLIIAKYQYTIMLFLITTTFEYILAGSGYLAIALGGAVIAKLAYDIAKTVIDQMKMPYKFYSYQSYLKFEMDVDSSFTLTEKNEKFLAAKAGMEAQESWKGWSKSFFDKSAWKQYRTFLAGKEAYKSTIPDDEIRESIRSYKLV